MPVINLRDQRKAFLSGVEQSAFWQNGTRIWAKPVSATPTLLALTDSAVSSLFAVQQVSAHGIVLSRSSGQRSYYSYNVTLPIGSRIIFNGDSTARWWVRQASDAGLSQNVIDVVTYQSGPLSVNHYVFASRPWVGFVVGTSEPASTMTISDFRVTSP